MRVGPRALDELVRDWVRDPPGDRAALVADDRVAPLYAAPLRDRLRRKGVDAELLTFRAGERSKTHRVKQALERELARAGFDRHAVVVAVGGGVTGDLAGYLAATWHRGVAFVQVPTSLLAMVDAAIGGKTAVNLPEGKNLVGAFHHPRAVYADVRTLGTLPASEVRQGMAEVVKAAAIADAGSFRRLERDGLPRDDRGWTELVARAIAVKTRVVRSDPAEAGRRAILNFGHTVGHALERLSHYRVRHGAAVAMGMVAEARLAEKVTGFPAAHVDRLGCLLEALELPTRIPARYTTDAIVDLMRHDKKRRGARVRYALPERIGRAPRGDAVTFEAKPQAVTRALEASR